jgi:hypothetical protein
VTRTTSLAGLYVRLERTVDKPCAACGGIVVVIGEGGGQHAASLRCARCNRHRGWLPGAITNFLSETVRLFGVPDEPFLIRDALKMKGLTMSMKNPTMKGIDDETL